MNLEESIGLDKTSLRKRDRKRLQLYINLKLASTGQPIANTGDEEGARTHWETYVKLDPSLGPEERERMLTGPPGAPEDPEIPEEEDKPRRRR